MYIASEERYEKMIYNRCGDSGLKLSAVSFIEKADFTADKIAEIENALVQ